MNRVLKWILILVLALAAHARAADGGAPTGNIEGRVIVAGSDQPLSGVELRWLGTNGAPEPVFSGTDGSFRMTGIPPGKAAIAAVFPVEPAGDWVTQHVFATAGLDDLACPERPVADWVAEEVPVTVVSGETRKDVLVRALKGGVALVRVLSRNSLRPLANVPVSFSSQLSPSNILAASGADGVVRVRLLPDRWQIAAIHGDEAEGQPNITIATGQTSQTEIEVDPALKTTGTVRDPGGAPAAGAVVSLDNRYETRTDTNGRYEITWWNGDLFPDDMGVVLVGEDSFFLTARSADGNLVAIRDIAETTTEQDLTLQPGVTISTTVKDPSGQPVTNALATMYLLNGDRNDGTAGGKPSAPDAQGQIVFTNVPRMQTYHLTVTAKAHSPMTAEIQMPARQTNRLRFPTVVLPLANQQLGGKILDADGKPLAGVVLQAWAISSAVRPVRGKPDDWEVAVVRNRYLDNRQTDSEGCFFFDEVCEGSIELDISYQGSSVTAQTAGGTTNILLRLKLNRVRNINPAVAAANQLVKITGTVRDPSGAPAAGEVIGVLGNYANTAVFKTDSGGHYTINLSRQATNLVMIARDLERNLAASHGFDGTITNIDLTLQPGLTLAVKALDANGAPIPSATEILSVMVGRTAWTLSRVPARADEQGLIEITALPRGLPYRASITSRGFNVVTAQATAEQTQTNRFDFPPAVVRVAEAKPVPTNAPGPTPPLR